MSTPRWNSSVLRLWRYRPHCARMSDSCASVIDKHSDCVFFIVVIQTCARFTLLERADPSCFLTRCLTAPKSNAHLLTPDRLTRCYRRLPLTTYVILFVFSHSSIVSRRLSGSVAPGLMSEDTWNCLSKSLASSCITRSSSSTHSHSLCS